MKSDELEERIAPGDGKTPGAISADQRGREERIVCHGKIHPLIELH